MRKVKQYFNLDTMNNLRAYALDPETRRDEDVYVKIAVSVNYESYKKAARNALDSEAPFNGI